MRSRLEAAVGRPNPAAMVRPTRERLLAHYASHDRRCPDCLGVEFGWEPEQPTRF
jgi:hypothetical protein